MARNHGDNAFPRGISELYKVTDKEDLLTSEGNISSTTHFGGDDIGSTYNNTKAMIMMKMATKNRRFKPPKTVRPPSGLRFDILILWNMLVDLAKVMVFCTIFNTLLAWTYCIRYQMTFPEAWNEKNVKKLASLVTAIDLICIGFVLRKRGHFSLAETLSEAQNASLSGLGKGLPSRPSKVRKSLCPPDPCPCKNQETITTTSDSETDKDKMVGDKTIFTDGGPQAQWQPPTTGSIVPQGRVPSGRETAEKPIDEGMYKSVKSVEEKLKGQLHEDAHEATVKQELSRVDYASASIPTGIIVEEDDKQWSVQERMKKVINLEHSRDGIKLSNTEKDTLSRIRESRSRNAQRNQRKDYAPPAAPAQITGIDEAVIVPMPQQKGEAYPGATDLVSPLQDLKGASRRDQILDRVRRLSRATLERLQNAYSRSSEPYYDEEFTDETTSLSTASLDLVPKSQKKIRAVSSKIPTSYLILTISTLMLALVVASAFLIPDFEEWLKWLWEQCLELWGELLHFLKTDVGRALMASLLMAIAASFWHGSSSSQPKSTVQYNVPAPRKGGTKDILKGGYKEGIKISYEETIPEDKWTQYESH